MSKKCMDGKGRWRSLTVGFRASKEENAAIDMMAAVAGMTKQDYCISRLLNKEVTVAKNPRAYIGLKNEMKKICEELARLTDGTQIPEELAEKTAFVADIYNRMRGEDENE